MFKTIEKHNSTEIIEKKSRFISNIYNVNNKKEAQNIIDQCRKKYYDSNHNCYAYIIGNEEKCSDDGEPTGTAGAPLLGLLKKSELNNILVVVTRYFGGILLGTGGLVRAYTKACQCTLDDTRIILQDYGVRYEIEISYSDLGNLEHICEQSGIEIKKIEYGQDVLILLDCKKEDIKYIESNIRLKKVCVKEENIVINIKNTN